MASRKLILLASLVLLVQGCDWWRGWRRQSRLEDEASKSCELIPAPARVAVPAVGPVPDRPSIRLVVTPDAVHVDNTASLGWLETSGNRFLAELEAAGDIEHVGELVLRATDLSYKTRDEGGFLIEALYDELRAAVDFEKRVGRYTDDPGLEFRGAVDIEVHPDVQYGKLARVLYTAGQAELGRFRLAAQGPDGPGHLLVEPPKFGCPPPGPGKGSRPCVKPLVTVFPAGIQVQAQQGFEGGGLGLLRILGTTGPGKLDRGLKRALEGLGSAGLGSKSTGIAAADPDRAAEPGKRDRGKPADARRHPSHGIPSWHGRTVLGPSGACPSVPRKGGSQDPAGLLALLEALAARARPCQSALLSASHQVPWSELAPVLSILLLQAGYEETTLSAGLEDPRQPECKHGVPAEAIVIP